MIKERMIELLLLLRLLERNDTKSIIKFKGKLYDNEKMMERCKQLVEEFLEPYALDSTSKE